MSIHSASVIGPVRQSNEDKHQIITNLDGKNPLIKNINLYSVFDGHGGKFVSKFLHDNISKFFTDLKVNYPLNKKYVLDVYSHIQSTLKSKHYAKSVDTGSTCLIVVEYIMDGNKYLNVCNTGDSRAVISRGNFAVPLTLDHKPTWPEEKYRIEKKGGVIEYDSRNVRDELKDAPRISGLSVSRAFGDISAEPYVINTPDIYRYKLNKNDRFMVLACDGLWDVLSNDSVVNYVLEHCYCMETNKRKNKQINIAKKLTDYAIEKKSEDNITVIVVFFDK